MYSYGGWLSRNLQCDTSAIPWQMVYGPQIKELLVSNYIPNNSNKQKK